MKLLRISGFMTYVLVVLLNAMTDLGHKIIIQNTVFKCFEGPEQIALTGIVNALMLIPFLMLFTPSGFLADKFSKNNVLKICAAASIPLAMGITYCYYNGHFWLAFAMTILLAAQSALYSPAKYGYIKELVGNENLAQGNAVVQAVTIVAILAGAVIYSMLFEHYLGTTANDPAAILKAIAPCGWLLIVGTILETIMTFTLPVKAAGDETLRLDRREYLRGHYVRDNIRLLRGDRTIWLSVVGLAIFWAVNQVLFAVFGAHLKDVIGETNTVVAQGLLSIGGLGIIVGSILAGRVSRNHIETGIIPLGAVGMTCCLLFLPGLESRVLIGILMFVYGVCGGLFVVPLNALIQFSARNEDMGKVLAGNNFVQTLVMLLFLGLSVGAAMLHISSIPQFFVLDIVLVIGTIYTIYQLPQSLLRIVLRFVASQYYNLTVSGLNNLPAQGGLLLLGNHVSYIDWAMISLACPRPLRFVMARSIYERWYLRPFLDLLGVIPISPRASKGAREAITTALKNGECVALFPEGALSRNGQIGEFKRGFEDPARESGCVIVPFYLRGLWGSAFSHAAPLLRESSDTGGTRNVTICFGDPMPSEACAAEVKKEVFKLSTTAWKEYATTFEPLHAAWINTAKRIPRRLAVADASGVELTQRKLLTSCLLTSSMIERKTPGQDTVGILLPPSAGGTIANLSAMMRGKCVVNLNYTSSPETVRACMERAGIRTIITSSQFMTRLQAKGINLQSMLEGLDVVLMEDLKAAMTKVTLLRTLFWTKVLPAWAIKFIWCRSVRRSQTAAILFSSGSEGAPKGVMLSHENIMGNVLQVAELLNAKDDEVFLGTLPLFHAFGLTVTTLLPLLEGIPLACQPDPTDAQGVGAMAARYRATFLCGTPTFLGLYARNRRLHPLMFESLRLVVAGAERLTEDVREAFHDKFGLDIHEGYGTTETTPVAAVNVRDVLDVRDMSVQLGRKIGTVGLPVPGSAVRIVDPVSMEGLPQGEDGLVLIGGPQIMQGYLEDPERTASAIVEMDGVRWYKTGDKGHVDADGFLTIVDRYSRFAKIGGEMVSLGAVEDALLKVLPEGCETAAVALPDSKKGEQIVALIQGTYDAVVLRQALLAAGVNPLLIPAKFIEVEAIPKLGTGKRDLGGAKRLAQERAS